MSNATFALAGNPNSGKTTLFNALTGARQHVGNYPGVTVEKKEGLYVYDGRRLKIVDLPGTYSLTAYSLEEVVARDFIVNEKPAAVIDIVDAANLERNLYLTLQFMEMGIPVIVALNMMDVATQRGMTIDTVKLADLLGVPVVATVARRGEGKAELVQVAERIVGAGVPQQALEISYGEDIDLALLEMEQAVIRADFLTNTYRARWVALKYMEGDEQIIALGRKTNPAVSGVLEDNVKRVADHLKVTLDLYPEAVIADHRYGYIRSILQQGVLSVRARP